MHATQSVNLTRDVDATIVPAGTKVTLLKGETAHITQSLGGSYTVVVNGNMFRIDGRDVDALGLQVETKPAGPAGPAGSGAAGAAPRTPEQVEAEAWAQLKTCYDPEIPVNIVDLGLIYDCHVTPLPQAERYQVDVKMTLTAPGCGMGPMLQQDVSNKLVSIEEVEEANVELVWDPPWHQGMMTEAAKLQLGLL